MEMKIPLLAILLLAANSSSAKLAVADGVFTQEEKLGRLASLYGIAMCAGLPQAAREACLRRFGINPGKSAQITPDEAREIGLRLKDKQMRANLVQSLKERYSKTASDSKRRQITDLTFELNKLELSPAAQASSVNSDR